MRYILALALMASPLYAQTPENYYKQGMDALETCHATWFQSRREEAAQQISEAATRIALRIDVHDESHAKMLDDLTDALRECTAIAYSG